MLFCRYKSVLLCGVRGIAQNDCYLGI
jgi:hypothetical protein